MLHSWQQSVAHRFIRPSVSRTVTLKYLGGKAPISQLAEKPDRFNCFSQPSHSTNGHPAVEDPFNSGGCNRRCTNGWPLCSPEYQGLSGGPPPAPQLDPHRTRTTLGMGRCQHRHGRRQPVTAGRRHPGGNTTDRWKRMVEEHRIRQRSPVAVTRANRFGKPTQFPTRSTGPFGPGIVAPVI